MEMWERRISHSGLRAFRVIRGRDPNDVEIKAQMQLEAWEERWTRLQSADAKRQQRETAVLFSLHQKEYAAQRTKEAQEQLQSLEQLLADSAELDHTINWESLKKHDQFANASPVSPSPIAVPPPPVYPPGDYTAKLSLIDKLIPALKVKKLESAKRKKEEADRQFAAAEKTWHDLKQANAAKDARAQAEHKTKLAEWEERRRRFYAEQEKQHASIDDLAHRYSSGDAAAVYEYCDLVLSGSVYPDNFPKSWTFDYITSTKTLICDYGLPNVEQINKLKEMKYIATRNQLQETYISETALQRLYDKVLYQVCLRTLYELFQADAAHLLETIAFNGWVNAVDKSTGKDVTNCIISVQATKADFMEVNLTQVDPKSCFKKFKGVSGSKLAELTPIRPVLQLNKTDSRFVTPYEVVDSMGDSSNLASMDWQDFENLIRELFEKEFKSSGGEVKITRASRDGGVDAVAFDPDPIRGGKIVIQAKRYTNVVGVSAVRDLYGTVMNEGATKGILVTTADYGQDSYEFAKDKPLTLLSGSELLFLLQKHGHRARIDLAEAKKLAAEKERGAKG